MVRTVFVRVAECIFPTLSDQGRVWPTEKERCNGYTVTSLRYDWSALLTRYERSASPTGVPTVSDSDFRRLSDNNVDHAADVEMALRSTSAQLPRRL